MTAASRPASISTVGLAGSTYHARAVSGGTSPEISAAAANVDIQLVPGLKQGPRYYIRQGQQVWKV